jgi:hypothetical protein
MDNNFREFYGMSNYDGINRNEIRDVIRRRISDGNAIIPFDDSYCSVKKSSWARIRVR